MSEFKNPKIKIKEKVIISNHSLLSVHTLIILTVILRNMEIIKILEVFLDWGKLVRLIRIDIYLICIYQIFYKINTS